MRIIIDMTDDSAIDDRASFYEKIGIEQNEAMTQQQDSNSEITSIKEEIREKHKKRDRSPKSSNSSSSSSTKSDNISVRDDTISEFDDTIADSASINNRIANCQHDFVEDGGLRFCQKCDDIAEIGTIDMNQEWQDSEASTSRYGEITNQLLPYSASLSVLFTGNGKKVMGVKYVSYGIKSEGCINLRRVQTYIKARITDTEIKTHIALKACVLYNKILGKKSLRAENRRGFIAACVYFACVGENIPITSDQVRAIFGINKKKFNEGYGLVSSWNVINNDHCMILEAHDQVQFAKRYCGILNLHPIFTETIEKMIADLNSRNIEPINTSHNIVVGMIVHLLNIAKIPVSMGDIEKATGISRATITKASGFIAKHEKYILAPKRRERLITFYEIAENLKGVGLNKITDNIWKA